MSRARGLSWGPLVPQRANPLQGRGGTPTAPSAGKRGEDTPEAVALRVTESNVISNPCNNDFKMFY